MFDTNGQDPKERAAAMAYLRQQKMRQREAAVMEGPLLAGVQKETWNKEALLPAPDRQGTHLQVDPYDTDKERLCYLGKYLAQQFMELNGVSGLRGITFSAGISGLKAGGSIGVYSQYIKSIVVNPKKCMVPVMLAGGRPLGRSWSFPGSKTDITPVGVVAHEVGHHVDYERRIVRDHKNELHEIRINEKPVTPYELCHEDAETYKEMVAEGLRLFITNPMLLKEGRPRRHKFFTEVIGLKTLHEAPWRDVLKHADLKIIDLMERWIQE